VSDETSYTIHFAEREVTPSFTLNQIGKAAFKRAEAVERGWWEDIITAQLMCALAMEAVLNHVGEKAFGDARATWAVIDRATPRQKLDAIAERLGLTIDMGSFPFQHFGPMFQLRNALAHGRSLRLATSEIPPDAVDDNNWLIEDRVPDLRAPWENMCDLDTARIWRESVYAMSSALSKAVDCIDPILVGDNASWSGSHSPRGEG